MFTIQTNLKPLKEAYKDCFLIGTAVSPLSLKDSRWEFVKHHFNAITAENDMKPALVHVEPDKFVFDMADTMIQMVRDNGMTMIGHTLVWHQQSPKWLSDPSLTRSQAIANMQNHITKVMTHFKGKIKAWDVVNEVFESHIDNPSDWRSGLRNSPWLEVIGPDFVEIAFRAAALADPEPLLYYNDFNMDFPDKREAAYHMAKEFRERGIKIDGIGMQGHYNMATKPQNVEDSIKRFGSLGVEVSLTELDVTVNHAQGQEDLTERQAIEQALMYAKLFKIFREQKDIIARVTLWGLDDATSWRGDRFPLPFDKNLQAKLSYSAIIDPEKFIEENQLEDVTTEIRMGHAMYGTPAINADEIDKVWERAEVLNVSQFVGAWEGASARLKTMWNEEYLFTLFEVKDPLLNASSELAHEQDSVEIFISETDNKTSNNYKEGDAQYRVNYENVASFGTGAINDGKFVTATKVVPNGYVVVAKIPFRMDQAKEGLIIGFDAQINDANDSGNRISIAKWNDTFDMAFQDTSGWGRLKLVKQV